MFFSKSVLKTFPETWINILHSFLVVFTNCKYPRTRHKSRIACIYDNIEGYDLIEEESRFHADSDPKQNREDAEREMDNHQEQEEFSLSNMQRAISTMTNLFPESTRPTGEDSEPFYFKLHAILEQMESLSFPTQARTHILYSLLRGKAREAASKIPFAQKDIHFLVDHLKRDLLSDPDKQDRRITRWNNASYTEFRAETSDEEAAARTCIKFLEHHQMDLPAHMRSEAMLLQRLQSVFRFIPWCSLVFQRSSSAESASAFASKVISAASNHDLITKRRSNDYGKTMTVAQLQPPTNNFPSITRYPSTNTPSDHSLTAFFAKTPPPPRYRRPYRYRYPNSNHRRPSYNRNNRTNYSRFGKPSILRRGKQVCFRCKQEGQFLRDCPQRAFQRQRLTHLVDIGEGAAFLLEHEDAECTESHAAVIDFIGIEHSTLGNDHDDDAEQEWEFHEWICNVLDFFDNHPPITQQANFIRMSIESLNELLGELQVHSVLPVTQHLLLDTGSPKNIASETWLKHADWKPIQTINLPDYIQPFRFAGSSVSAIFGVCLIATVCDIRGQQHYLRMFTFALPDTPIPFLVGLQTQRSLGFDVCLREANDTYVKVNAWDTMIPLSVTSHPWMNFKPCNVDPDPKFDWIPLIQKALDPSHHPQATNIVALVKEFPVMPEEEKAVFPVAPWKQDSWQSTLKPGQLDRLHRGLRHLENSAMLRLFRQQNNGKRLPAETRQQIEEYKCHDCAKHAQLPRVPKLALPPEPTPNVSASLDVMSHTIRNVKCEILVILDDADMMLRLKKLDNRSALIAFHAYFTKWIAYFDAPNFTIVDRGSNLASKLMSEELRKLHSQLCSIPTESPWSIGSNERSHHFIHRAMDKLLEKLTCKIGSNCEKLLGDLELAWNMTPHTHNITPHFLRYGTMPRMLGELDEPSTFQQRTALMEIPREEVAAARASRVIARALDPYHRNLIRFRTFSINEKVWFYRKGSGWRVGTVSSIDSPTIMVARDGKFYPTHEHRVRPYFGEISIPPEICDVDELDLTRNVPQYDLMNPDNTSGSSLEENSATERNQGLPISRLINGCFIVNELSSTATSLSRSDVLIVDVDETLTVHIQLSTGCIIDSSNVLLTHVKLFRPKEKMTEEERVQFSNAKREEIAFLLSKPVVLFPRRDMPKQCEFQALKWILSKKKSTNTGAIRYRARLVSAAHRSRLRNSVHGNAPTVAMSTMRILYTIIPSWIRDGNEPIHILTRDVTKAYLQSHESKRLIFYDPPTEVFEHYAGNEDKIWKARVQLYGEVEAGLYWNKTLVPWLLDNFPELRQSLWDPSLLYSPTTNMALLLCTDDMNGVMPSSGKDREKKITERFVCREAEYPPTEFKGIDIRIANNNVILSQEAYVQRAETLQDVQRLSKAELNRTLNDEELSEHRKLAGRLAWIATGTSPLSSFPASAALQGKSKQLKLLHETDKHLRIVKEEHLAKLTNVPLDLSTASVRVYSDGAYQNLEDKHSQIGFVLGIADQDDNINIFHWSSCRTPRRAHSTEEAELMALDIALRTIRNMRHIVFQLMKREIPIVCYVDNQALWDNLMNETAGSIPDIMARCRSYIHDGTIASVCLISGTCNPADAMTKRKPNGALQHILAHNSCQTPPRKVFMMQTNQYRNAPYIPTTSVPMPDDIAEKSMNAAKPRRASFRRNELERKDMDLKHNFHCQKHPNGQCSA